ncbi:MAG TPA: glutamyl-tRNA reductase [Candidatus Binatia bacterium]|nr:glutamyl-tRNA reductase [Candidatus Binatia bacterium]
MPLTQIACLGLSHHSAPVELREQLSCALLQEEHLQPAGLAQRFTGLGEVVMLVTCNRIELYAAVEESCANPRQLLGDYLTTHHSENPSRLRDYLYYLNGEKAAQHLVEVASGLDSQILGEPQILGQVTSAFMQAIEARTIGPLLTTLFRGAIRAGKKARAQTAISTNPASIGSVSISLAERLVGPLQERNVLVVGAGEMGRLAIDALRKRGVQNIALANRTRSRAERLAQAWQGKVHSLEELPEALCEADVVITATAAPYSIMDAALLKRVLQRRQERDLVIVDIALPRDVETEAGRLPHVHLFTMDDLRQSLDDALAARRREIPLVQAVIAEEMARLRQEFRELAVSPLIGDLRQKAEAIRQQEMQRTLRFLGDDVDPKTLDQLQHLSRSLVNKLLHEPTMCLRQHASNGHAGDYAAVVRELFDLKDTPER